MHDQRFAAGDQQGFGRMQREWPQIRQRLALDAGEQANFDKLLLRFTEPQAEAHLQRDLNAKIKPLKRFFIE